MENEFLTPFLAYLLAQNYAKNTIDAYRRDIRQFLKFLEFVKVHQELKEVTEADINDYLVHLTEEGIAPSSRARKLNAVKSFFRFLLHTHRLKNNPAHRVKTPKTDTKQMRVLTEIEYRRLRDIVRNHSVRDYAVVELVLQTGLRASEVCDLKYPCDIEFSSPSVHASVTVRGTKSRKDRLVPLNSVAERAIKAYLALRPPDGETDNLFLTNRKTPLTRSLLHRLLLRYFRLANIVGASFHTLRHTFATHSINRGTNLIVVQETLGHKHLTTTQKYMHFIREKQVQELEKNAL